MAYTCNYAKYPIATAFSKLRLAKDIRDAHSKDAETGEATTPVDDILDSFEELKAADNATQAQMVMYSKLLKINFTNHSKKKRQVYTYRSIIIRLSS